MELQVKKSITRLRSRESRFKSRLEPRWNLELRLGSRFQLGSSGVGTFYLKERKEERVKVPVATPDTDITTPITRWLPSVREQNVALKSRSKGRRGGREVVRLARQHGFKAGPHDSAGRNVRHYGTTRKRSGYTERVRKRSDRTSGARPTS